MASCPNTPVRGRWRLTASDGPRRSRGPRRAGLRRRPVRPGRPSAAPIVRVHWYEGSDAFGQRALADRRGRHREVGHAARRHRGPNRSTSSSTPTRTRSTTPSGRARARTSAARPIAEIRTLFALIPPVRDRRPVGRDGHPARADPPRVRHRRRTTRTTSRRAGSTRAWRSTSARATGRLTARPSMTRRAAETLIPLDGLDRAVPDERRTGSGSPTPRASRPSTSWSGRYGQDPLVKLDLAPTPTAGPTTRRSRRPSAWTSTAFDDAWLADLAAVTPAGTGRSPRRPGPCPPGGRPGRVAGPPVPAPSRWPPIRRSRAPDRRRRRLGRRRRSSSWWSSR